LPTRIRSRLRIQIHRNSCDRSACGVYRLSLSTLKIRFYRGAIILEGDLPAQLHELFFGKFEPTQSMSCCSENCLRSRAYRSSEMFAGVPVIASASSITNRSVSLKGVKSLSRTALNFSSLRPAFLPTAELTSIQKGQPMRAAARILPSWM
jgi:hypothetical protein